MVDVASVGRRARASVAQDGSPARDLMYQMADQYKRRRMARFRDDMRLPDFVERGFGTYSIYPEIGG